MAYIIARDSSGLISSMAYCVRDASGNYPAGEVLDDDHPDVAAHLNPPVDPWDAIRAERNRLITEVEWRISRNLSEVRQGLTPTEPIEPLDAYVQALRDIPQNYTTPEDVVWPTAPA